MEHFTIAGENFLAVANYYNGDTYNFDSQVMRWDGSKFVAFQNFTTHGASDIEHFKMAGENFLAVANYYSGNTYNVDSQVMRWDWNKFVAFQNFTTHGASDIEHFTIAGEYFLAVANYYSGNTHNVDSQVMRWDGNKFVAFQNFTTHGASDIEHFTMAGESFLAVANYYNGDTYNVDSQVMRWDGSKFVAFQNFTTHGAQDMAHFTSAGENFLAVANYGNGNTHNVDSQVMRWDGNKFVAFQNLATHGAQDMEYFTIAGENFLAVANWQDDNTQNVSSHCFRWLANITEPTSSLSTSGLIAIGLCLGVAAGFTGCAVVCRCLVEGKDRDPAWAAISLEQLNAVRQEAKVLLGAKYLEATMYNINQLLIRPKCERAQKPYAHIVNGNALLHVEVFVSHAWAENFDEFVNSVNRAFHLCPIKPNVWICAFALVQSSDPKVIEQQVGLNRDPRGAPFTRALRRAEKVLVVRNRAVDLYSRIWCCWELAAASGYGFLRRPGALMIAGPATFSQGKQVDIAHANASNERDKDRILQHLRNKGSYTEVNDKLTLVKNHVAETYYDEVVVAEQRPRGLSRCSSM
jgi:hypothetical protein